MTADMPPSSEPPETGGLINKRMEAERGRVAGFTQIWVGVGWLLLGLFNSLREAHDFAYWFLVIGAFGAAAASITLGITQIRAQKRRVAEFETLYGKDAGRQPPRSN
jgi:hypothetical protein